MGEIYFNLIHSMQKVYFFDGNFFFLDGLFEKFKFFCHLIVVDVNDCMEIIGDKSMVNRISFFCLGFNYLEELFKR